MERAGEGLKYRPCLLRGDDDSPVVCGAARLDGLRGITGYQLVQDAGLVDAQHDAANLGNRCPGKLFVRMQRFQPALNVEGFDVLGDFISPAGDEVAVGQSVGCLAVVPSVLGRTASCPKSARR